MNMWTHTCLTFLYEQNGKSIDVLCTEIVSGETLILWAAAINWFVSALRHVPKLDFYNLELLEIYL